MPGGHRAAFIRSDSVSHTESFCTTPQGSRECSVYAHVQPQVGAGYHSGLQVEEVGVVDVALTRGVVAVQHRMHFRVRQVDAHLQYMAQTRTRINDTKENAR